MGQQVITITQANPDGPFTEALTDTVASSSGSADAGKVVLTNPDGRIDSSMVVMQLPVATDATVGVVKPDGTTITIAEDGTLTGSAGNVPPPGGTANYLSKFSSTFALANSAVFESSGTVGIGTTSPLAPLHIYRSTSGGVGGQIILDNNGTSVNNQTALTFSDGGNPRAQILVGTEASPFYGAMAFQTGIGALTERMRITGSGFVGIGTTTPRNMLDVLGGIHIGGSNTLDTSQQGAYLSWNTQSGTGETDFINVKGGGPGAFNWYNLSDGGAISDPIMTLDSSGNLHPVGVILASGGGGGIQFADGSTQASAAVAPPSPPLATSTTPGIVRPDNSTITVSGGVISASGIGGSANHFINTGGSPSFVIGGAAGSGSGSVLGGDAAGTISVIAGSGVQSAGGPICTINFAVPYPGTGYLGVVLFPTSSQSAQLSGVFFNFCNTSAGNTVGFTLYCSEGMAVGEGYGWSYLVIG